MEYRVYPIRWIQLLIYFFGTFTNAMISMTYVPIVDQTSNYFHLTTTDVNLFAFLFLFLCVGGTIMTIFSFRTLSMRWTMIIGSLLNLGVLIRFVAFIDPSNSLSALIVGQICPALAAPFFLNSTALFAARWFSPKQRDLATAIVSMANPLGSAIGSLIPSLIVNTKEGTSKEFLNLFLIEHLLVALSTIIIIIFFASEPPTPPSPSEEHHQSIHIRQDLRQLLSNKNYLLLLFGFSLGLALINAITSLLYQLIEPFGYSSNNAGIFGALILVTGLFNAFISGFIMDRTHAYRKILKSLLICASLAVIFFVIVLRQNQLYLLGISIGLMGFFLLPLLPVSFECAVECTYPLSPEWSTGFLMCTGSILGGGFIFLLGYLVKLDPIVQSTIVLTPASLFILCTFLLSALSLFLYQGPYLRLEAEKNRTIEDPLNN